MLKSAISRNLDFCAKHFFLQTNTIYAPSPLLSGAEVGNKSTLLFALALDNWRERHSLLASRAHAKVWNIALGVLASAVCGAHSSIKLHTSQQAACSIFSSSWLKRKLFTTIRASRLPQYEWELCAADAVHLLALISFDPINFLVCSYIVVTHITNGLSTLTEKQQRQTQSKTRSGKQCRNNNVRLVSHKQNWNRVKLRVQVKI